MRKVIALYACSLDGMIEGPKGEIDWIIFDEEETKELARFWKDVDVLLYGRKTYELVIAMQQKTKGANPFAHMKHYVFSRTLKEVAEGFLLIKGETKDEVLKIKNDPGKNIVVFGGAEMVCSLTNLGVVDELQLGLMPVLLGSGKPLFSGLNERVNLKLASCKQTSKGVIRLAYQVSLNK
jgi:dihydrofolate reductase